MMIREIMDRIDGRLADAQREITALEQARAKLVIGAAAGASATRTSGHAPSRPRTDRRHAAPRSQPVTVEALERALSESDQLTTTALAKASGGDRDSVLTLLKQLEAEGKVRRSGERRATRWRLFTEEDAIAERAAELATRSRAGRSRGTKG